MAWVILNLASKANRKVFRDIKEDGIMFEELRKIMQPEFDEELNAAVDKAVAEAVDKAVNESVTNTTDIVNVHAVDSIIKRFGVSLAEACDTLHYRGKV